MNFKIMVYFDRYVLVAIFITFVYLLCCTVCWKYCKKCMPHRYIQRSLQNDRATSAASLRGSPHSRVHIQANYVPGHPNTVEHVKCSIPPSPPPPGYKDIELYNAPHLYQIKYLTTNDLPTYDDVMTSHAQTLSPSPNLPSG